MDKSNLLRARCAGCNKSFFKEDAVVLHQTIGGEAKRKLYCDLDCFANVFERSWKKKQKSKEEQNKLPGL